MIETPKVGVNAVIFNQDGLMLLEKREFDGTVGIPGGWVDWGESPEEAIVRELKEETGLDIKVEKLVGILSRKPGMFESDMSSIHILYLCSVIGGNLSKSDESLEVGYWDHTQISNWHKDHEKFAEVAVRSQE